ncbi:alpha/beta hydrolase [Mycolicibacterium sp. 018/SC-01/001]|uniref:alpha/beta hydrolase n=1 Tax=Mycolicibacterium sp. 018/SC-01/001 TaxID=2592069 RepID=UPI00117D40B6|nr:alpha/beta fold hydrolase [Mycolicibacterium sp. 018/SC-01/001]TRW87958.1 alpha/beta hydrolase [Mycolicibacterium sp. 018/SC-01/001]
MAFIDDIEFDLSGTTLRGKLARPDDSHRPAPVVILQSGLGGTAESLYGNAAAFNDAGLAVLMYDHRYTGYSDGEPRQLFDPWQQCRDLRDVITHLTLRSDVDGDRIGLWGVSIGGANALFTAATDSRVSAVTAIIPPVSGWSARRLQPADTLAELEALIPADRQAQLRGEKAVTIRLHGRPEPGQPVMFSDHEGLEFVENAIKGLPSFRNEITVSTLDRLFEMEVRAYAERITQPLLMILASQDTVAPVEEAREMYDRVPEPKDLVEYPGQHYEILSNHFPAIIARSAKWLADILIG